MGCGFRVGASMPFGVDIGFGARNMFVSASASDGVGLGAGVSSTVECLPVVQGGMERNSSNVRTRGLQHFQPRKAVSRGLKGRPRM